MRSYTEPTCRNILRKPLVLGVPFMGLVMLALVIITIELLAGGKRAADLSALGVGAVGYIILRILNRFSKPGWEEALIYPIERLGRKKGNLPKLHFETFDLPLKSPDTLDQADLIYEKRELQAAIQDIRPDEPLLLHIRKSPSGSKAAKFFFDALLPRGTELSTVWPEVLGPTDVYTLVSLPVTTDPLWLSTLLAKVGRSFDVLLSIRALDPVAIKKRIELSRKQNARDDSRISNIDSEITFEETSRVLQGISRGDETIVEMSLVIVANEPLDLDPQCFCREKNTELALCSITELRRRSHRSHIVRAVTAADLVPTFLDPEEEGAAILSTLRRNPLYFSPADPRLEALHWLVVGASGSGKSFFTGLVLKRMVEAEVPMSVLFVDHNRSFRRIVRWLGNDYLEPSDLLSCELGQRALLPTLNRCGTVVGIELSDLAIDEKAEATHLLLSEIEHFLKNRETTHPIYLVLDECWNFLRVEPVLVQRAFREFRKLNGAVVAITQSLSDFITDSTGQTIFQNAPVRILLRQGEDLSQYRGTLGLNDVELSRLRLLRQVKGEFSECLIKTPFLSRIGRLYPTEEEHELLRTDNIRAELVREAKSARHGSAVCV